MAVTFATAQNVSNGTDLTSWNTSSNTPPAGALLIAFVNSNRLGAQPDTPTLSGDSLTWTLVSSLYYDTGTHGKLFAFVAGPASGSAFVVTVDFGATTHHGIGVAVISAAGATTTAGGLDGIVATNTTTASGSGTAIALTFPNAGSHANNRPVIRYGFGQNTTVTPDAGAGWVEFFDAAHANPNSGAEGQWNTTSFDTTNAATLALTAVWGAIGLEVTDQAAAGGGGGILDPFGMSGFFGG